MARRKGLKPKKPYIHRLFAQIGSQAFKVDEGKLRLPISPKEWIYIPLNSYVMRNISVPALRLGSVTLTASTLSISVKRNAEFMETRSYVGIDINVDSAVAASDKGEIREYAFKDVPRIIQRYRKVLSHFKRNDYRIRKKITSKYGSRKCNKVVQRLHKLSKAIVEEAVENKESIILEKLTDIRDNHRRGNYEGRRFRHRMNSWPFHELQRQIIYKATWNGISTLLVDPRRTSRTCSVCGAYNPKVQRWLVCHACGSIINRHENTARNILARGVRFTPSGPPIEAMVPECLVANPESRWREVKSYPMEI